MKKLIDSVPKKVDAAYARHSITLEKYSNLLRWFFCVGFALTSVWLYVQGDVKGALASLIIAALWLGCALIVSVITRRTEGVNNKSANAISTWIDLIVVCIGILLCLAQDVLDAAGFVFLLSFYPVITLTGRHNSISVLIKAALIATAFYLALLFGLGGSITPPITIILAMFWATALAGAILTLKPKKELAQIVQETAQEAYNLGTKDKELEVISLVHSELFPVQQLEVPGLYCSSKHLSGLNTSGDYYQVFETRRGPLVMIGDLPGEGLQAAMNVARLHQHIAEIIGREEALVEIAESLNSLIWHKYKGERVLSCILARWEGANLHYLNAGHLPAIRISKRVASSIDVNSPALGISESGQFTESVIEFPKGDLLVLYTDGSYSGLAADKEKGASEMLRMVNDFSGGEINTLCHRLFDCGQPEYARSSDDSTVVVIRRQELIADEKESEHNATEPATA